VAFLLADVEEATVGAILVQLSLGEMLLGIYAVYISWNIVRTI
jgi:hypothetical protein